MMGYDESLFVDSDMAKYVKGYYDVIDKWRQLPGCQCEIETKVPLFYSAERTGTIDAYVVDSVNRRIFIGDLKYGAGVSVQARKNTQAAIYAKSKIKELGLDGKWLVTIMIYQPRIEGEEAIRLWVITTDELDDFCADIDFTAAMILGGDEGVFRPSDKTCQFCNGVSICTARATQLLGGADTGLEVTVLEEKKAVKLPPPDWLTVEQLVRIITVAPEILTWLNKCQATGAAMLHEGKKLPGFKLVEGRSNRAWVGELSQVVGLFEAYGWRAEDICTPAEVRSPAQLEEFAKSASLWEDDEFKAAFKALVYKPEGKPVMVPEDHKKPAIDKNLLDHFDDLTIDLDLLK